MAASRGSYTQRFVRLLAREAMLRKWFRGPPPRSRTWCTGRKPLHARNTGTHGTACFVARLSCNFPDLRGFATVIRLHENRFPKASPQCPTATALSRRSATRR